MKIELCAMNTAVMVGFSHRWVSGPIVPPGGAKWLNRAESSQIWSFNASSRESWKHATPPLDLKWFSIAQCQLIHVEMGRREVSVGGRYTGIARIRTQGIWLECCLPQMLGGLILAGMPSLASRLYAGGVT